MKKHTETLGLLSNSLNGVVADVSLLLATTDGTRENNTYSDTKNRSLTERTSFRFSRRFFFFSAARCSAFQLSKYGRAEGTTLPRFFLDAPLPVVATVWFVPPNFHWTRYDNTQLLICVLPSFETFFPSFWLTQRSLSPHTMRWCHTSVQIINHTLFCSRFCGKRQLRR